MFLKSVVLGFFCSCGFVTSIPSITLVSASIFQLDCKRIFNQEFFSHIPVTVLFVFTFYNGYRAAIELHILIPPPALLLTLLTFLLPYK
jgi:hypothetical protein